MRLSTKMIQNVTKILQYQYDGDADNANDIDNDLDNDSDAI